MSEPESAEGSVATARLLLHPVGPDEARRILAREPGPDDRWAADYPFDGDRAGLGAQVLADARHGDQRPFGYYQVRLREADTAIGGIGFKGPPMDGVVEVGYGLAPSGRGSGYATEALTAFVDLAGTLGVTGVRADTDPDNVASQRVLEKAGFRRTHEDATAVWFERTIRRTAAHDAPPHRA